MSIRVIYTTVTTEEEAARIAIAVVEERLAACANIVPRIRSIYRWEGRVEDEAECLMILKTRPSRVQALMERILQLHSYDVPDVVSLPVETGHGPYIDWVLTNTTPTG